MESDSATPTRSETASHQLQQLRSDQRWARLISDAPAGYDAIFGGCLVVHLLFVGLLAGLSSGELSSVLGLDSDGLLIMAMVNLFIPVYGQVAFQRAVAGSWRGTPETRPSNWELSAAVASYLVGLVIVIVSAAQAWWSLMVVFAWLAGMAWVLVCRHWMVRYRAEFGYPTSVPLYVKFPLFVVAVFTLNMVCLLAMALVGRVVPDL